MHLRVHVLAGEIHAAVDGNAGSVDAIGTLVEFAAIGADFDEADAVISSNIKPTGLSRKLVPSPGTRAENAFPDSAGPSEVRGELIARRKLDTCLPLVRADAAAH